MYPLSKRMPSVSSSSRPKVLLSSTVITPSLPTLSIASAIISPIAVSPAEMEALADQRLREHGRRRRAVAGHVVGLLRYFLDELGADLLPRVLELDLLGDGHAIVGDRGCAPLLLEYHVTALGAEGYLHGVGELVHTALEAAPGVLVKRDHLRCHRLQSSVAYARIEPTPATDGSPRGSPFLPREGASSPDPAIMLALA